MAKFTHKNLFCYNVENESSQISDETLASLKVSAALSYGFENVASFTNYKNVFSVDKNEDGTIKLETNTGVWIATIKGVEYAVLKVHVNNTIASGIVTFTVSDSENNKLSSADALIPGDINKTGIVDINDRTVLYNMISSKTTMPEKGKAGNYVFELSDLNCSNVIDINDRTTVYNMVSGKVTSN